MSAYLLAPFCYGDEENKKVSNKGVFYGVGVGPGDPELMTLKAVRIIEQSPVICLLGDSLEGNVAFGIAKGAVANIMEKEILFVDMPMVHDEEILSKAHENSARKIEKVLDDGKDVAMLILGDISIYSSFMYLDDIVKNDGYETRMISGIPSFVAAAARAGISLTRKGEELRVIPICYDGKGEACESQVLATKVYMKIGRDISKLRKCCNDNSEIVVIENCGMDNEKIYYSLKDLPEKLGYYSLAIVK